QIFAYGIASFLAFLRLPPHLVITVMTLGISAFALTTLDSVSRIARMTIQEFFSDASNEGKEPSAAVKFITNKYTATIVTCVFSFALAIVGYAQIWPLFGSANQLLGALALVACSVFLKKTKRKGVMLWVPMGGLLAVTLTALTIVVSRNVNLIFSGGFVISQHLLQLLFGILLLALGLMVAVQGVKKLTEKDEGSTAQAAA
ncbi:MAG: carbon starvation protein A, partial [Treponema sp.]|nr:carbon starvation protein A [Treponema sp.]